MNLDIHIIAMLCVIWFASMIHLWYVGFKAGIINTIDRLEQEGIIEFEEE